jgi:hypothetical protein
VPNEPSSLLQERLIDCQWLRTLDLDLRPDKAAAHLCRRRP